MREIKFRAWNKPVGRMYYWGSIKDIFRNGAADERNFLEDHNELMQYTGLKDKNGTEIYEGDILTMLNIDYLVEWNDKKGRWNFYNPELSHPSYWGLTAGQMKRCEVIGNIYENQELLK